MAAEEQNLADVNFTIDHLRRLERDHVLHGAGHDEVQFCVLLQDNCRFSMANALSTERFHRCTDFKREREKFIIRQPPIFDFNDGMSVARQTHEHALTLFLCLAHALSF